MEEKVRRSGGKTEEWYEKIDLKKGRRKENGRKNEGEEEG